MASNLFDNVSLEEVYLLSSIQDGFLQEESDFEFGSLSAVLCIGDIRSSIDPRGR